MIYLLGFQSSFSMVCYLEESLSSICMMNGEMTSWFVLPVFWRTVLQCGALLLLERAVSYAIILTGVCFIECNISHRRSVAVLCMLFTIRSNPMHPLYGALPVPFVPVWITSGAFVTDWYTNAPPHCRTSQFRRNFISLSVSLWN